MSRADKLSILSLVILLGATLSGCDRIMTSRQAQLLKDADLKSSQGDFLRAINLYEAALDDSPHCADIHYKLALLYEDKMKDPLNALHHLKRCLVLSPNGSHANEIKELIKHDEVIVMTSLSGDSVVPRAEAARLRNENLALRQQLEEHETGAYDAPVKGEGRGETKSMKKTGGRTYVVHSGDTLVSISRKFYRSSARWKQILAANKDSINDPTKLKVGQSLFIP